MSSEKSQVIENDIPGVSIRRIDEAIEVHFIKSLTYDEWSQFEYFIDQLLDTGSIHFIFYLQSLYNFTSCDIGMWVLLYTKINTHSGKLDFVLGHNSNILEFMKLSKLDQIFSIIEKDPDQGIFEDPNTLA
jgi:hypothetical protein